MRQPIDQWVFVLAAYGLVAVTLIALIAWSWLAMRKAERRRERTRRK